MYKAKYLQPQPRTGPDTVLHLKLYDGHNWITAGPVLHAFDYSLNSHPGTVKGTAPTFQYPGIDLPGTDEHIEVADHADFTFGNAVADSPLSIRAWICIDVSEDFAIVSKMAADNSEWKFLTFASGKLGFRTYSLNGTNSQYVYYDTALTTGQRYHAVITYDGRGGTSANLGMKIYLDGVKVDVVTAVTGTYVAMDDGTAPVWIGRNLTDYANGRIDDVIMFKRELSALDVLNDYNLTRWRYGV